MQHGHIVTTDFGGMGCASHDCAMPDFPTFTVMAHRSAMG
jgi:hypothetical protein